VGDVDREGGCAARGLEVGDGVNLMFGGRDWVERSAWIDEADGCAPGMDDWRVCNPSSLVSLLV